MAAKKKTKRIRSKRAASKKRVPARKHAVLKKKSAMRKTAKKRAVARKSAPKAKRRARGKSRSVDTVPFPVETPSSGLESGDLQGLSNIEDADSESVDELLEEGNAFEAEAVAGVEHAGDAEEREVHTHEVPEDDVPEEYLDKD